MKQSVHFTGEQKATSIHEEAKHCFTESRDDSKKPKGAKRTLLSEERSANAYEKRRNQNLPLKKGKAHLDENFAKIQVKSRYKELFGLS